MRGLVSVHKPAHSIADSTLRSLFQFAARNGEHVTADIHIDLARAFRRAQMQEGRAQNFVSLLDANINFP